MADRLTAMEVFVRAVRRGGFSAAARELRISPAMATKHVDALEARLGATLIHRTTRRLSLTEAGADYLERAERILAEIAEAEADASSRSVVVEGQLRVSAPASFGILHIAPLIPEFLRRHPGVTVEVGFNDRYVDLIEERWDMAIRIGRLADSSLIARKLVGMRMAVVASPSYLASRSAPRRVDELIDHDCLGHSGVPQAGGSNWAFGADGAIKVPVRCAIIGNNGEGLIRAAIAGQGIVYGPRFIAAEGLRAGLLQEISLDRPLLDLGSAYALTHPTRRPAAKTRAWITFLLERLPALSDGW